jgi:hypothetical protein
MAGNAERTHATAKDAAETAYTEPVLDSNALP